MIYCEHQISEVIEMRLYIRTRICIKELNFKIFSPYNTRPEVLLDRILSLAVFCFLWLLLTPGRARQRQIHGHQVISM